MFRPRRGFKVRLHQLVERARLEAKRSQAMVPRHWFIDQWQEFEFPSKRDMSFDLRRVLESKRALRRRRAGPPLGEILRMLNE